MDEHTISPAGDPFHATPHDTVEAHYASLERLEAPHVCLAGTVYIGHLVEDPGTGEESEAFEALPCRRCAEEAR